jgi:hypothetical protein
LVGVGERSNLLTQFNNCLARIIIGKGKRWLTDCKAANQK